MSAVRQAHGLGRRRCLLNIRFHHRSVDILPPDRRSHRDARPRAVQRIEGPDRPEFRICICCPQCRCPGARIYGLDVAFHRFAYFMAQVYGYAVYQHRITMIRRRDPGHFGAFGSIPQALPFLCLALYYLRRPNHGTSAHKRVPVLRRPREFHHTR